MYKLHQIYIDSVSLPNKRKITFDIVKKYVNEIDTPLLMYTINYPLRKRYLDFKKAQQTDEIESVIYE